ncbi:ABC transporter ATP-binding protein/permease [Pseudonocardia charpentierae]|uniref:ABC transporter ATP-binding protein/permease n=1 Tax=Pseudonocardia charpentierae TaxID=3075545 RepID=A0ABU2N829_9PSEU|nr:ABC transporter ATP-binding protein/permease [Pseudonocardia sp. DSM 45834]MDT0349707.1 ABC transporter ATP-binding protein/permease [Pseudonocardia sp. DSM 45834]
MTVDWSTEWFTSLVWIVGVTLAALVGCVIAVAMLTRFTVWGRQFRRLSFPFFSPRGPEGWRPLLNAFAVLLFVIIAVRVQVVNSYITNGLYTALQELDAPTFGRYILIFTVLSVAALAQTLLAFYLQQRLVIRWRVWLNNHVVGDWLDGRAYHRGRYTRSSVDNPDQRIQEDVASMPAVSMSLATGAVGSLVALVSFTLILWQLSGPLVLGGVEIPRGMVFAAYLYVIIATVFAFRIGRPLIGLNFRNELLNASFRYSLVRLRDNSEGIAFHRGEGVERGVLNTRFAAVIDNAWAIVFRSLKFQGFNVIVSQFSQIIPLLIQAPRYFAGQLTLGDVQQTASAFGQVHDALSFFRLAYDDFASYRAVLIRLTGLLDADADARALPSVAIEEGDGLEVRDLTVRLPDDGVLVDDLDLRLTAGDALLVAGPSGSGKTTLLRSFADLWPYADGTVRRPLGDDALFLSQQPYVPLGDLRTALAYPGPVTGVDDDRAAAVLRQVQLPHLVDRLDEETDWSRRLSPGEQQRLGFARLLLVRPKVAFLDEATSALDEGMEHALYTLLREELPDTVIVSVGHRSTLNQFHAERLELLGQGRWQVATLSH